MHLSQEYDQFIKILFFPEEKNPLQEKSQATVESQLHQWTKRIKKTPSRYGTTRKQGTEISNSL